MEVSFVTIPGQPATKRVSAIAATGATLAVAIVRQSDGLILDADDGTFTATPGTATAVMTESADVLGLYSADESRFAWQADTYAAVVTDGLGAVVGGAFLRLSGDLAAEPAAEGLLEYALCTLGQLKAIVTPDGIPDGETTEDALLVAAINEATDSIESVTGRRIKRRAAAVESYRDVDEDETEDLWPDQWPFDAADITSLQTEPDGDFTSANVHTYAADEFRVEGRQRIALLAGAGTTLYPGAQTVKLVCTPGYAAPLADIVGVCKSKAARIYWRMKGAAAGVETETVNGQTVSRPSRAWTPEEQAVLDRYTREKDYKRRRRDGAWSR